MLALSVCLVQHYIGGIEIFHEVSIFGENEDLYKVELALGTTRVFSFEILV